MYGIKIIVSRGKELGRCRRRRSKNERYDVGQSLRDWVATVGFLRRGSEPLASFFGIDHGSPPVPKRFQFPRRLRTSDTPPECRGRKLRGCTHRNSINGIASLLLSRKWIPFLSQRLDTREMRDKDTSAQDFCILVYFRCFKKFHLLFLMRCSMDLERHCTMS